MKTEEKEVKIEKMILNIEGEKVSLSMEQAKKLKKILDELFGKEIVKEIEHHHHHNEWWYKPYYWGISNSIPEKHNLCEGIVYCSNNASLEVQV